MQRGRKYEATVANIFAAEHPEYSVEFNRNFTDEPEVTIDSEYPFLMGHPDRLLFDEHRNSLVAGLEIKTASVQNLCEWGKQGTDFIPQHYLVQCQWYAGLMDLPEWRLAVAFFNFDGKFDTYREYEIAADRELFDALRASAIDFYQGNVLAGIAPPITEMDSATARWINERYPRNIRPLEKASEEEEVAMDEYLYAKKANDETEKCLEQAEAKLKLAIGDRDGLFSDRYGKVTWKATKDTQKVDYKSLCESLRPSEELVQTYTKTVAGTRRLYTRGLKDGE